MTWWWRRRWVGFVIENTAPGDPEYLHAYSLWDVPADVDRAMLMGIAAEVTLEAKGVAVALLKGTDTVVFTCEALVAGPDSLPSVDQLAGVLPRVQRMLWNAVSMWLEKLKDASEVAGIEAATRAAYGRSDG